MQTTKNGNHDSDASVDDKNNNNNRKKLIRKETIALMLMFRLLQIVSIAIPNTNYQTI